MRLAERVGVLREQERDLDDWRIGTLIAEIYNLFRDRKKQPSPFQPRDFFPHLPEATRPVQTAEDQIAIMKAWTALMDLDA